MKKLLCLALALVMVLAMVVLASCGDKEESSGEPSGETSGETSEGGPGSSPDNPIVTEGEFVYKDSVSVLAKNWNPHTYQDTDDAYVLDYITLGLYSMIFNDDGTHKVEGKDAYEGYIFIPEMAADFPEDITEEMKAADNNKWNIPADATAGYAYKIKLNPNACWENGTKINAKTYEDSMERLLRPTLKNYRASDYYSGSLCIAGAQHYANIGNLDAIDIGNGAYALTDLTLGDDGIYVTPEGYKVCIPIDKGLVYFEGDTLQDYVDAYGEQYFNMAHWQELVDAQDEYGVVYMTEETRGWIEDVISNPAWGEGPDFLPNYIWAVKGIFDEMEYSGNVGCWASDEYELTLVFEKSLIGFYLNYALTSNWIVEPTLYDSCLQEVGDTFLSTYNSNKDTTLSYGPYKMTYYEMDKKINFEKNENWYGWTDNLHVYRDKDNGLYFRMYQTTKVTCQVIADASTRKQEFLAGNIMSYGLQAEDYESYGSSDYLFSEPGMTTYFLILNGNLEMIQEREASADYDKDHYDTEIVTLEAFRRAMAVTYDRDNLARTISPARSGGYAIISDVYIYDPETCGVYRDTEPARKALCDFYSVDVSKYASLEEACDSITGYDPETAKKLYQEAYEEAIEKGFITDADGDGKSDQKIRIVYALSAEASDFLKKTLNYLNEKANAATEGTGLEGMIQFEFSTVLENWVTSLQSGEVDTCLAGWNGSKMDPFGLTDLYVNPAYQYDGGWFVSDKVDMTLTIAGKEITMDIHRWSDALNGSTVKDNAGTEYNFGFGQAEVEDRLAILAGIEGKILETYDYLPILQDGSKSLLSKQVQALTKEYNSVLGYGAGVMYLRYLYNEEQWAEFCKNADNLKY